MKFKFQLLAVAWLTFMTFPSFSQKENGFKGTIVYAELLGFSAGGYTINAERNIFHLGSRLVFAHVGLGGFPFPDRDYWRFAVPVGVSLVKGKGNNHTEIGFTFTYGQGIEDNKGSPYRTYPNDELECSKGIFFVPSFGYRFQKPGGGFFLRVHYAPMYKIKEFADDPLLVNARVYLWNPGLALGYCFNSKKNKKE